MSFALAGHIAQQHYNLENSTRCEMPAPQLENGLPIFAYDVNDFCRAVGIGKTKVYEMIKEGRLRSGLLEGKRIIPVEEAERIILLAIDSASACAKAQTQQRAVL
ncbi:helix-turn-helix domain-containing protein [Asticcacaulis sp.]|uniref:helix-turn-helix domain-containing protein n=1 Tax=Asticcacaulis sp. TaxID=1872648 RepID=UPI002C5E72B3|nr:helix-turn-helix domain-containing protein [Asticcacaulis sp.]HTM81889.1 helix-turn-helix domain-containing protein [Asticcacaulis sp.]